MGRRTREPEARRQEFLDTARRLFGRKGYEKTSVDDIVDAMGVAKGLFYYYFRSKEALLGTLVDGEIGRTVALFEAVAVRGDLGPLEKIQELLRAGAAVRDRSRELGLFFRRESNRHLHADMEARAMERLVPAMAGIIRQGVSEGLFDTRYSEEAAQAFFAISNALGPGLYGHPGDPSSRRRLESALHLFERLLGAEPGSFEGYGRAGGRKGGKGAKGDSRRGKKGTIRRGREGGMRSGREGGVRRGKKGGVRRGRGKRGEGARVERGGSKGEGGN